MNPSSISTNPDFQSAGRILVIGAGGFLGKRFGAMYREMGMDVIATFRKSGHGQGGSFDLTAVPDRLPDEWTGVTHAVIAAGTGGVMACESDPATTRAVNVDGTLKLAAILGQMNVHVTWLSTDGVFDGEVGRYTETSPANPVNEYGRQKAETEGTILDGSPGKVLVVRLSKVYGTSRGDGMLIDDTALSLLNGRTVFAATDNRFCPTWVDDVARGVIHLQANGCTGLYHLSAPESMSRFDAVRTVASVLGINSADIRPVRLNEFHGTHRYPLDTSMECRKFYTELPGFTFITFEHGVERWKTAVRKDA
jgi:dTDP-4-dehydrorhamnose reductase